MTLQNLPLKNTFYTKDFKTLTSFFLYIISHSDLGLWREFMLK